VKKYRGIRNGNYQKILTKEGRKSSSHTEKISLKSTKHQLIREYHDKTRGPKEYHTHLGGVVVAREREELLVYLTAFINISMQINLRCLYRGMAQVFLHHAEILRSPI